jgi:two-component system, NarL family, response regulator LiaR
MLYLRHAYMIKRFAIYGILVAVAAISLQLIQYKLLIINNSIELYSGVLALIFTITGIYAGQRLTRKKEVVIEKLVYATPEPVMTSLPIEVDEQLREKLGISKREFEILELMSQ